MKEPNHVMGKMALKHVRTATVQASLRIRAVSQEPMLFAHVSDGQRENVPSRN